MAEKKAQSTKDEVVVAIDQELEEEKAHGQTDAQQEYVKYHEGKFQTHDPITGEKRDLNQPAAKLDLSED